MNRRHLLLSLSALSAAVASGFTAIAHAAERMLPVVFKVTGAKYMKGQPRIAVGSYPVTYMMAARAKATTGSFQLGGAEMAIFLDGPQEADLRELANEAHKDLLARFDAAGMPSVPPADVAANPDLSKVKRAPGNTTNDKGIIDSRATKSWVTYSADNAPLFDGQGKNGPGDMLLLGKFGKPGLALGATFVQPRLIIDFTNLNASKQRVVTSGTARVGGEVEFSIDPLSIVHVITPDKKGLGLFARLDPKSQVLSDVAMKGELAKDVKAPPVNFNSIFGKSAVHAVRVDVAEWKDQVRAAYRGYNQAIVDEFKKARA